MEHKKQMLTGVVVSDKMDKTRVVLVASYVEHPKYKKYVKQTKRYKAHDPKNEFVIGDKVEMESCAPVSRHKSFLITKKLGTQDVEQYLKVRVQKHA